MALSIVASGVLSTEASVFSKIVQTNTISASAAYTSGEWEYTVANNTVKITKYTGNKTKVTIPLKIDNKYVTELGYGLFKNNATITEVIIQNGTQIKKIPDSCFLSAENLQSVTIPSGITTIDSYAFKETAKLQSISLPTVDTINSSAFIMSGIKTINVPKIKTINEYAFSGCKNLESFTIPTSIVTIGNCAFNSCTGIKSVDFKAFPKHMKTSAFLNCSSLTNVNVPNAETFGKILSYRLLRGSNISKINNETIVTYRSKRYSPNAEPVIKDEYYQQIQKYLEIVDEDNIKFFEEYLQAEIRYIVKTNTSQYMTDIEKLKVLHDWVCNKVDYAYDSNGKPDGSKQCHVDSSVFFRDTTVCDGYARALTLLLNEAGIEAYYLDGYNHAWCMVKIGKNYYHVDACHDDGENINSGHFLVSDTYIKLNCQAHENWKITKPSSRYTYTIPVTIPTCPYTVGAVNMDERNMCAIDENKNCLNAKLIQKYLLKQYDVIRGFIYIDGNVDSNGQPIGINDETILDFNYDGTINMLDALKYYIKE